MNPDKRERTRKKEARPQEIVQAALEIFQERGFAGAKIDEIARRAGAAKGTIYNYFKTKDELFEAVVRENISPMFSAMDKLQDTWPDSSSELLRFLIKKVYKELVGHPERRAIMKMLVAEGDRFPHLCTFYYNEILIGARRLLQEIVQRGIETGEFRDSIVAEEPQVLIGPALMATLWNMTFYRSAPIDLEKFSDAHVDMILNGLRTRDN